MRRRHHRRLIDLSGAEGGGMMSLSRMAIPIFFALHHAWCTSWGFFTHIYLTTYATYQQQTNNLHIIIIIIIIDPTWLGFSQPPHADRRRRLWTCQSLDRQKFNGINQSSDNNSNIIADGKEEGGRG